MSHFDLMNPPLDTNAIFNFFFFTTINRTPMKSPEQIQLFSMQTLLSVEPLDQEAHTLFGARMSSEMFL